MMSEILKIIEGVLMVIAVTCGMFILVGFTAFMLATFYKAIVG